MPDKTYSTIVFDLGNTLLRFDHNLAVKKLVGRFGIDPKTTYELFFDSDLTRPFEKGVISPEEFYRKATAVLGIDIDYHDFFTIWCDIFWEDGESCALAKRLKRSYKLFLLSNINKMHFGYIRSKFDIIKIFDELILSFEVGAMKPEKLIYEDTIRRAGGDRSRLLYIDDREDLVEEALRLGIDSIKYEGADLLEKALRDKNVF